MKTFNIITNLVNGAGLQQDYALIRGLLESYGHKVNGVMSTVNRFGIPPADINIFLEHIVPYAMHCAKEQWVFPNSEWWYSTWDRHLPYFAKILCKTRDCYEIWSKKVPPANLVYTGFESNDYYRPEIVRLPVFLHLAGLSVSKNTQAVAEAWRKYALPYPLLVVSQRDEIARHCQGIKNVTLVARLSHEEVIAKMNECTFHLNPSMYEGFGHYIHEALSCGGVVITTDAPPMNSFAGIRRELLIPVASRTPSHEAFFNFVDPKDVAEAVHRAAAMSREQLDRNLTQTRSAFLSERDRFRQKFREVVPK